MTNRDIADVIERIADMLQIKEDNPFKIRAYRKAANAIYHLDENIIEIYKKNSLEDIPGVGKAVKGKIEELIEKGSCEYYDKLQKDIPPGVLDMLAIPGIGHKTVKVIYENLGIDNLEDLLKAAQHKKIRTLPGMGSKTEYNIKKGIEMLKQNSGKVTLGIALPLAMDFCDYLLEFEVIENASIVGSIRRGKSLVSDIDILISTRDFDRAREKILGYREIKKILVEENDHIKGLLSFNIEFEIIIVLPQDYYNRLVWTTGSKEHRSVLKEEYGFDPDNFIKTTSEEEIYQQVGLPFIVPELRENQGEFKVAREGKLPELIKLNDIKGDLHTHSDWSDGAHKIHEMVTAARSMGYSYLAVTDHSKSLPISGGLNEERLAAQCRVIDELNKKITDFKILKGIEVDILKDGSLDFSSDILENLDIVVASVHSNFKLDKEKQTERILKVIRNENVNIIGHLTGRLLNRRSGYEIDVDKILLEAARHKVILEINSHPDRLDIDERTARKAKEYGIKIAINSDAHDKNDLRLLIYGINNARRGWLEKEDVINTWDIDTLIKYLKE